MTAAQTEYLARVAKRSGRTLEDVSELWVERAAIREYLGRTNRAHAERDALDDVANEVLRVVHCSECYDQGGAYDRHFKRIPCPKCGRNEVLR
jgi:ribosomal protein S27E